MAANDATRILQTQLVLGSRDVTIESAVQGVDGEDRMYAELRQARTDGRIRTFFRPDFVVVPHHGLPFMVECKNKERFLAPPFDGHGLDEYQVRNYELMRDRTGIRTLLVVYERDERFAGWLDHLETCGPFTTGKSRCRIYPLEAFS